MPNRHTTQDDGSRGFGGCRDWLLVVLGVPVFVVAIIAFGVFRWFPTGLSLSLEATLAALLIGAVVSVWQYRRLRRGRPRR